MVCLGRETDAILPLLTVFLKLIDNLNNGRYTFLISCIFFPYLIRFNRGIINLLPRVVLLLHVAIIPFNLIRNKGRYLA